MNVTLSPEEIARVIAPALIEEKLLKARAAAEILSLSPQGFRKLAKAENLDHYDLGGSEGKRWSIKDIQALKQRRRVTAK
jgi:predicted HTH domain antitoxin